MKRRNGIRIRTTLAFVCITGALWNNLSLTNETTSSRSEALLASIRKVIRSSGEKDDPDQNNNNVPRKIREKCERIIHPPSSSSSTAGFSCAPWLNESRRTIVFNTPLGRFQTWSLYYQGKGYLGGEAYWSASLAAILESLDFRVIRWTNHPKHYRRNIWNRLFGRGRKETNNATTTTAPDNSNIQWGIAGKKLEAQVYRIISDVDGEYTKDALYDPNVMCKVRQMHWWWKHEPLDRHCILSPFEPPRNSKQLGGTFVPFMIHSEMLPLPPPPPPPARIMKSTFSSGETPSALNVFLLSKRCEFHDSVVQELVRWGLVLHATCFIQSSSTGPFTKENPKRRKVLSLIQNHGKLKPLQFRKLMNRMDIVIGFGKPLLSPTPFEAVANGAIFLNPILNSKTNHSQNDALQALVGEPYVYNYILSNHNETETAQNILTTVRRILDSSIFNNSSQSSSSSNPKQESHTFRNLHGFIPPSFSVCELRKHVCKVLIEDNSLCENNQICLAKGSQNTGLNQDKYKSDLKILRQSKNAKPPI